jgi:hypothetical protein
MCGDCWAKQRNYTNSVVEGRFEHKKLYPIKVQHENLKNLVGEEEISTKVHISKYK